jgi:hypothetical protein
MTTKSYKTWAAPLLGLAICGLQAQAANLIQNGGFETGDLTDWTAEANGSGNFSVTGANTSPISGNTTPGPASGNFYAVGDETGPVSMAIGQDFTVAAGSTVTLSFDMFNNDYSGASPVGLGLNDGTEPNQHSEVDILSGGADLLTGAVLDQVFYGGSGTGNPWTAYSYDISAAVAAGGTFEVDFANVNNQDFMNMGVDNVSITAGAAPDSVSTLGCLGLVSAGLCSLRRRFQR